MAPQNERYDDSVPWVYTVKHAARATGLSERRLRDWDRSGIFSPSLIGDPADRGPLARHYNFADLVGLRTLELLKERHNLPSEQLRRFGAWLKSNTDVPWDRLSVSVVGDHAIPHDLASEDVVSTEPSDQPVSTYLLGPIAEDTAIAARQLTKRTPDQYGIIVRDPHVLGNTPIIEGTRIPTRVIWEVHEAGYDTEAIIRDYPRLTPLDVERAIEFERRERMKRAS